MSTYNTFIVAVLVYLASWHVAFTYVCPVTKECKTPAWVMNVMNAIMVAACGTACITGGTLAYKRLA